MAVAKKKHPGGRPTKYNPYYPEIAEAFCREDGFTDKQLGKLFGVVEDTINRWKNIYPEFFVSIKKGKWAYDTSKIVPSLVKSGQGYSYDEVTKELRGEITDKDGKVIQEGELVTTKVVTKQVAPNPVSMIFWLKNREPEDWSDKKEIDVKGSVDTVVLSQEEHDDKLRKIREAGNGIDEKSIFGGGGNGE
jgi:hypothetical protein